MDTRTLKELAQEAIDVQDACNLLAVVNGMKNAIDRLQSILHLDTDTDSLRQLNLYTYHPIVILWANKIAHLTRIQSCDHDYVSKAWEIVNAIAHAKQFA